LTPQLRPLRILNLFFRDIPKWLFFRYNVLPDKIAPHRQTFERMIIRDFASLLENKKDVNHKEFSDYTLVNDKIDVR